MEDKTGCMEPAYTRNAFTKAVLDKELPDDALAQEALDLNRITYTMCMMCGSIP